MTPYIVPIMYSSGVILAASGRSIAAIDLALRRLLSRCGREWDETTTTVCTIQGVIAVKRQGANYRMAGGSGARGGAAVNQLPLRAASGRDILRPR